MAIPSIGSDHFEQLSKAFRAVTLDPVKNAVQYFFPFLESFFNGHYPMRVDLSQEAAMPTETTRRILEEIQDLTRHAQISREVLPYTALSHSFSSCGGVYSCTAPVLFIPEQHLFRRQGISPFPQERVDEHLRDNLWLFSDDEVRFFISCELAQIQESSMLIKLAIKVAVLTAFLTIIATPLSAFGITALCVSASGLYLFSERLFHFQSDQGAVQILERRGIANPRDIAIQALEKLRQQNLYRRENSAFGKLFILPSGDHLLDVMHPFLTNRIENLRA